MLNFFTWQEYLTAVLSSTVIYYLIIIALFYRSEFKRFFKRKSPQLTYAENPNWPKAEYINEEELHECGLSRSMFANVNTPDDLDRLHA